MVGVDSASGFAVHNMHNSAHQLEVHREVLRLCCAACGLCVSHHHDVVAGHVGDLLVAHDTQVGAEEDDEGRPLMDVEPVLKGLWGQRERGGDGGRVCKRGVCVC